MTGLFQSTLPTRGSDRKPFSDDISIAYVSIHAPHEGERHVVVAQDGNENMFQSTLPTRGSDTRATA